MYFKSGKEGFTLRKCKRGFIFIETMASLMLLGTIISAFVLITHTIHLESELMKMEREANYLLFKLLQERESITGIHDGIFGEYEGKTVYADGGKKSCLSAESGLKRKMEICLPAYAY